MTTDNINRLYEKAQKAKTADGKEYLLKEFVAAAYDDWPSIYAELTTLRSTVEDFDEYRGQLSSALETLSELQAKADALAEAVQADLQAREDEELGMWTSGMDGGATLQAALLKWEEGK